MAYIYLYIYYFFNFFFKRHSTWKKKPITGECFFHPHTQWWEEKQSLNTLNTQSSCVWDVTFHFSGLDIHVPPDTMKKLTVYRVTTPLFGHVPLLFSVWFMISSAYHPAAATTWGPVIFLPCVTVYCDLMPYNWYVLLYCHLHLASGVLLQLLIVEPRVELLQRWDINNSEPK